jgi:hypothetical protein
MSLMNKRRGNKPLPCLKNPAKIFEPEAPGTTIFERRKQTYKTRTKRTT